MEHESAASFESSNLRRIRDLDPDIDDGLVAAVFTEEGGWKVISQMKEASRLLWVPEQGVVPRVGDKIRLYGGHYLRGLDINGQNIFYKLPALWEPELIEESFCQVPSN